MYFCLYQTPLSCLMSVFVRLSMCVSDCLCVCVSFFVFPLSLLPPPLFLSLSPSFFLSLSLTLAVSIFGETRQEQHPVKSLLHLLRSVPSSPPPDQIGFSLFLSFVLLSVGCHSRRMASPPERPGGFPPNGTPGAFRTHKPSK